MVAAELYRVIREIEKIEKELETLTPGSPEWEDRQKKLREARAERSRLKNMLEGAKDS